MEVPIYRKISNTHEYFMLSLLEKEIFYILNEFIFSSKNKNSVIDIGCGNQPLRNIFEQQGWQYKGLDFKQNTTNNIDYIQPIDESFLTPLPTFDLIICTEVLEHVLNWQQTFQNFKQLLKPEGLVIITCPHFYPLHEEPYDFWRATPYALERFAKNHNLKVIYEKRAGDFWDVLGTFLSFSYVKASQKTFKSKFLGKIFYNFQHYLLRKLTKGVLQKNLVAESPFYMSNVFLLKNIS